MNLELALRKGLKEAKYFAAFCWGSSIIIYLLIRFSSKFPDTFDLIATAFMLGLSLGATAGWDTVKGNVKKLLQTSDESGDKNE